MRKIPTECWIVFDVVFKFNKIRKNTRLNSHIIGELISKVINQAMYSFIFDSFYCIRIIIKNQTYFNKSNIVLYETTHIFYFWKWLSCLKRINDWHFFCETKVLLKNYWCKTYPISKLDAWHQESKLIVWMPPK